MAKKILFVDDDPDWRTMVGLWLHGAGFAVVTAENIHAALDRVDQSPPDLAILDVNLGGEDGIKLLKLLRSLRPTLPIILYTSLNHDDDTILQFIQEGAYQYVRKGGRIDLIKAVQMLLEYEPPTAAPAGNP